MSQIRSRTEENEPFIRVQPLAPNEIPKAGAVPLTCHGHSRPVTHLSFSTTSKSQPGYFLISACKDNNPMLRDGTTGDWIGTFFGHKGAVYQARLSADRTTAATASADFTARVWDAHSGEEKHTLQHNHIVRAVAFPPGNNEVIATGGMEKKLRIFNLRNIDGNGRATDGITIPAEWGEEIGQGKHQGTIKAIVWTQDPDVLVTAADDKKVRWWNLKTKEVIHEQLVHGDIGTCEFTNVGVDSNTHPILCIAAGTSIYFYGGPHATDHVRTFEMGYEVASVALHPVQRKFVTGAKNDTWPRVYEFDTGKEIDVNKGHHGPVWSISFSPDGKLYATGSEDGTIKMWKNCEGSFGLWKLDSEIKSISENAAPADTRSNGYDYQAQDVM